MNTPIEIDRETGLIYRILPTEDWSRLVPIFQKHDWFLPPRELANASVVENSSGKIVGIQILQLVLHAEPTYIDPDYSGKVNYLRLWDILERIPKSKQDHLVLPGYCLLAPTEKVERMAELGGFKVIEGKLYRKLWSE